MLLSPPGRITGKDLHGKVGALLRSRYSFGLGWDFRFVKVPPKIIPDATGEHEEFCDEPPLSPAFVVGIFLQCVMCVQSSAAVPDPVRTVKHSGLPVPRMTLPSSVDVVMCDVIIL